MKEVKSQIGWFGDVDELNNDNETPLNVAVRKLQDRNNTREGIRIIKYLIKSGAVVNSKGQCF